MSNRPLLRVYNGWDYVNSLPMVLKGETGLYSSLRWENRWNTPGEFEIHLLPEKSNLNLFEPFDVVELRKERFFSRESFGVVIAINLIKNTSGSEIVVRGKMLSWILSLRRVAEIGSITKASSIMCSVALGAFARWNSTQKLQNRYIFGKNITTTNESKSQEEFSYKYDVEKTALAWIEEISNETGIGFCVDVDFPDKKFHFKVQDFRAKPTMINVRMNECMSISATKSVDNLINSVVQIIDNNPNVSEDSYKVYVVSRRKNDGSSQDIRASEAPYIRDNNSKSSFGAYSDCVDISNIEVELSSMSYVYGRDYSLGDICRVYVSEMGMETELPIMAVTEVWEEHYSATVTFGEKQKNVFEKMRKDAKRR